MMAETPFGTTTRRSFIGTAGAATAAALTSPATEAQGADRAASRPEAAAAVLRVLARDRRAACLAQSPGPIGRDVACELAVRCGLAVESGDCLPGLPLSGGAALDLIQRAVDLLGAR